MPHIVLLVEPDVDALGELAEGLRTRGLEVLLADSIDSALARVQLARVTAVLLAETLFADRETELRLAAEPALAKIPRWVLVGRDAVPTEDSKSLPRHDPETIARRLFTLPSRTCPVVRHPYRPIAGIFAAICSK
jgi:hypothetical protein